jgi:hypothetical protein
MSGPNNIFARTLKEKNQSTAKLAPPSSIRCCWMHGWPNWHGSKEDLRVEAFRPEELLSVCCGDALNNSVRVVLVQVPRAAEEVGGEAGQHAGAVAEEEHDEVGGRPAGVVPPGGHAQGERQRVALRW